MRMQTAGLALALSGWIATTSAAQKEDTPDLPVVGLSQSIEVTPSLRQGFLEGAEQIWVDSVWMPDASFLKAHLVNVNLRKDDVLILRSRTGKIVEEIRGRGPKDMGSFWALSAFGDELVLEFRYHHRYRTAPFAIDQVIVGDPGMFDNIPDEPESLCSPGDFENVVCYQSDSDKWDNVLASVGVMSVGGSPVSGLFCSGSNVSPRNFVLTNDHCISSQSGCDSAEFVFKYYRQNCGGGATTPDWQSYRCDDIVASSPFISCDAGLGDLDFALCSVIGDPASTFGAVTPDPVPLTDGEGIYIVQHPAGRPHEITHGSGNDVDVDGPTIRYYDTLDTEGGSSGSPIFRESDDMLVGLHHCGGCSTPGVGNRGMRMSDIYPHIEQYLCDPAGDMSLSEVINFRERYGNGDVRMDIGETWEFDLDVRSFSCDPENSVSVTIQENAASALDVTILNPTVNFGNVMPGETSSRQTIGVEVAATANCGDRLVLDAVGLSSASGSFSSSLEILDVISGEGQMEVLFFENFLDRLDGWTVVDGGELQDGTDTWSTVFSGGGVSFAPPYAHVTSFQIGSPLLDESLVSPVVDFSAYREVALQFNHGFFVVEGGLDEIGDIDVRSTATGGAWVNVARYMSDDSGNRTLDLTEYAAGEPDVQVRFRYYNSRLQFGWSVDDISFQGIIPAGCDTSFWEYGQGCSSGGAAPHLSGKGSATANGIISLEMENGSPSSFFFLFLSATDAPSAGPCEFLIGFPAFLNVRFPLDSAGEFQSELRFGPAEFIEAHIYMQAISPDPSGGIMFSNGLDMLLH